MWPKSEGLVCCRHGLHLAWAAPPPHLHDSSSKLVSTRDYFYMYYATILTEMRMTLYIFTVILFIISLEISHTVALHNIYCFYVGVSMNSIQVHPRKSEINHIQICKSISMLSDFELCQNWCSWTWSHHCLTECLFPFRCNLDHGYCIMKIILVSLPFIYHKQLCGFVVSCFIYTLWISCTIFKVKTWQCTAS